MREYMPNSMLNNMLSKANLTKYPRNYLMVTKHLNFFVRQSVIIMG